ncbi:MAG: alanine racemase [Candidatus Saccharimonadales bacterium]
MLRRVAKQALDSFRHNTYRTLNTIEIGRERLLHNIRLIQQQHQDAKIIPVLKGNAYGHGITEVASILNGAAIDMLAVDGYFEADRIRHISRHRILVMGYVLPENVRLLDARRCSFVVQDTLVLHALGKLKRRVRVHIELNTGMNRLGLSPDELDDYLKVFKKYPTLELEGIMTHLADADNEVDALFTDRQVALFDEQVSRILDAGFAPKIIHVAQTAGSTKARSRFANAVRLGIGTYGINPLGPKDAKHVFLARLQPVLELKSTIIKVLELQKGDKVSYNCTFTAPRPMRVGVLPLGYYEGVPRALSNKGMCTHGHHTLPIVGRVCMDHTMVDLTGTKLGMYDEVTVISSNTAQPNSIAGMQAAHGLFAYSTLTGLSSSVRRDIVV